MAPRIGIVCDYLEEGWPSMDLVADMLARELGCQAGVSVAQVRPRFVRRFTRMGGCGGDHLFNADRVLNRFVDYPRFLKVKSGEFDLFHIIDHSYAHLACAVGADRCVVTCHDLDAFRPVLQTNGNRGSWLRVKMARRILGGFGGAAAVSCVSAATRDDVVRHNLAAPERLTINPNGVAAVFNPRPDPCAEREACRLLGAPDRGRIELVNVGSTIPRKRIDVLLRVLAALRAVAPRARLIRVGGALTPGHRALMSELGLPGDCIVEMPFLSTEVLAAIYRRAALAVLPSEYEGFGLPAIEAQACGTAVVLSDIPVFREIGGPAAAFCPVADVDRWTESILNLLGERRDKPRSWRERIDDGMKWSGQFTWKDYAGRAAHLYRALAAG